MLTRIREALSRAEDHWLTELVGVCRIFAIPHTVLLVGLIVGRAP